MPYHRFRIGQRVVASPFGMPPSLNEITGVLPVADGIPFYEVKSVTFGTQRAIAEPLLRPAPSAISHVTPRPLRSRRRARWHLLPVCA